MLAEVLIYAYALVSISILLYNIFYNFNLSSNEKRINKRVTILEKEIEAQFENIRVDGDLVLDDKHIVWMKKHLVNVKYLLAFDRFLKTKDIKSKEYTSYAESMYPVALYLARVYNKKDDMEAAYFSYFLSRYATNLPKTRELENILLLYLNKNNFYSIVNTLKALCILGSKEVVTEALINISLNEEVSMHAKIITEILMTFNNDTEGLIDLLWFKFDRFSETIKIAILDYIRYKSGKYKLKMFDIMIDNNIDKELRLRAIRYFGKYPYNRAKPYLLEYLKDYEATDFEYATISASALASYPTKDVVDALVLASDSSNWYIRYNAMNSLASFDLSDDNLIYDADEIKEISKPIRDYHLELKELRGKS